MQTTGLVGRIVFVILLSFCSFGYSQTIDTLAPTIDNSVVGLAVQPDGRILVSGFFVTVDGQPHTNLVRLFPDGTVDHSFQPSFDQSPYSILVLPDNKIVVGGAFSKVNGQTKKYLARLLPDGTLDSSFSADGNNNVNTVVRQRDSKLLVGGAFTNIAGYPRSRIARLHPDGSVDETFNPQINGNVSTIALKGADKILVGGAFTAVNNVTRSNIACLNLDGSLDATFNADADAPVSCVTVGPAGEIFIGGNFMQVRGSNRLRIARLLPSGEVDPAFAATSGGSIDLISLQANGKLTVAGYTTDLNGVLRLYIGRLNSDGTLDTGFNPSVNAYVLAGALQADGKFLFGGMFTNVNGFRRQRLARLHNAEPLDEVLSVSETEISWSHSGSAPYISHAEFAYSIDGTNWTELGAGTWSGNAWSRSGVSLPPNSFVRAQGVVSGSRFSAGQGLIETRTGPPAILMHPVNATVPATGNHTMSVSAKGSPPLSFEWFKDGVPISNQTNGFDLRLTNALGADAGSYWVVVSNVFGSITSAVAKVSVLDPYILTSPRSVVLTNAGLNTSLNAVAVGTQPISYQWEKDEQAVFGATNAMITLTNVQASDIGYYRVVASNAFGSAPSTTAYLAANLATLTSWQPNVNGTVNGVVPLPDGRIVVYGSFTTAEGQTRNRIARYHQNRTLDPSFSPSVGATVRTVTSLSNGQLLIGGSFTSIDSQTRNRIARLNENGTVDTNFMASVGSQSGLNQSVSHIMVHSDGKIYVAGTFSAVNGQLLANLCRLHPNGSLDTGFLMQTNLAVTAFALQGDGKVLFASGETRIRRLNTDGSLDETFAGILSNASVTSILWCSDGKVLAGGNRLFEIFNEHGTSVTSGTRPIGDIRSFAMQANGKPLFAGEFTNMFGTITSRCARLTVVGTPDLDFNPQVGTGVLGLSCGGDGTVFLNGDFTTAAGQSRFRIAEFNKTDQPMDALSITATNIEWSLSDGFPMAVRTTFDISTNQHDWIAVGSGEFAHNKWSTRIVDVLGSASVRARAYVTGGFANSSSYYIERGIGRTVLSWTSSLSRTNLPGTVAQFGVNLQGAMPSTLVWYKDGIALTNNIKMTGASSNLLTISNVFGVDGGYYTLVASNSYGMSTSAVAQLVVLDPFINTHPTNQNVNLGQNASFSVAVSGSSPRFFQWRKDGEPISYGTNTALVVTNVQRASLGRYDVLVSNQYGSMTSTSAVLSANLATNDSLAITVSGQAYALAIQTDDKFLIGGRHTLQGRPRIARVETNGIVDASAPWSANESVFSIAVQTDQKILVAGWFTNFSGLTRTYIGRYNADGSLDESFAPQISGGVSFPGVYSVALQPDNAILVGGDYRSLAGQAQTNIGRLFPNGTADPSFTASANDIVYPIALQPDGKILLGGEFTQVNGVSRQRIGRLHSDGSLDTNFNASVNSTPLALAVQPDGKIVVVGGFATLSGATRNRIGRLHPDGSIDGDFNPNANNVIRSVAIQADGKLLIGGDFTAIGGIARSGLARLNPDGTLDTTFNVAVTGNAGAVHAVTLQKDGKVLIGGNFSSVGGQTRFSFARIINSDPASQTLQQEGSILHWKWDGTSPAPWRTTFEASTDGVSWTYLGSGVPNSNVWSLANVQLTEPATIRARGFIAGGKYGCSTWFIEQTVPFSPPPRLLIVSQGEHFGFSSNRFGFQVNSPSNDLLVVERSSDLLNWMSIATNFITSNTWIFKEPEQAVDSPSFYRLRKVEQ